jgi:hypothetical protein
MVLLDRSIDTVIKPPTMRSPQMPSQKNSRYMNALFNAMATRVPSSTTEPSNLGSASSILPHSSAPRGYLGICCRHCCRRHCCRCLGSCQT